MSLSPERLQKLRAEHEFLCGDDLLQLIAHFFWVGLFRRPLITVLVIGQEAEYGEFGTLSRLNLVAALVVFCVSMVGTVSLLGVARSGDIPWSGQLENVISHVATRPPIRVNLRSRLAGPVFLRICHISLWKVGNMLCLDGGVPKTIFSSWKVGL